MKIIFFATAILAIPLVGSTAQLIKTYRLKNGDDLSLPMLFLFSIGMFHSVPYAFLSKMGFIYKVAFILQTFLTVSLTLLTIHYRQKLNHKKRLVGLLALCAFTAAAIWAISIWMPKISLEINGFLMTSVFTIRSLPQIYRTWKRKRVDGITPLDPITDTFYSIAQLFISIELGHGIHMIVNQLRCLSISLIAITQYCYYKANSSLK